MNVSSDSSLTGSSSSSGSSRSSSPFLSATPYDGFAAANKNLRSFLTHPIGILLASLLNDATSSLSKLGEAWNDLNINLHLGEWLTYQSPEATIVRDRIFASAVSNWKTNKEKELTKNIKLEIQSSIENSTLYWCKEKDPNSLTLVSEKRLYKGKVIWDFVMAKKNADTNDSTKRSAVMIVEFGINHNIWWKKMHQILLNVKMLCKDHEKDPLILDQPILLTIITVNKRGKQSERSSINEFGISDFDKNTGDSTAIPTCGETLEVRFGVFLCTRRHDGGDGDKYSVALLWRKDTFCVKDASIQFGKILHAAQMCASLREHIDAQFMKPNSDKEALYQYLGPNCCRIGDSVYRCYDNRLRYTERRPDMYERCPNISDDCETVLDISDTGTSTARILQFGQRQPNGIEQPDWLWNYRGRVKIITTKFHKGVHYAGRPEQFLPIVAHLKALHQGGFVHGDIRAYNMVLSYDNDNKPNGKLIDLTMEEKYRPTKQLRTMPCLRMIMDI